MRVTILDYGSGNLHSLAKAIDLPGAEVRIEADPVRASDTEVLVLPGVGAFPAACERLAGGRRRLREALEDGLPAIGICLGMQLLFDASEEGPGLGLGFLEGRITRLHASRVPHIGWNRVDHAGDALFAQAALGMAYYANGFVCRPEDDRAVVAWSTHERDRFPAAVRRHNVLGVQFHPEKSSRAGVTFLRGFIEQAGR